MPTKQQVVDRVISDIISNNQNEITADVLQPILLDMIDQCNDLIGNVSSLPDNPSSLVQAILNINNNSGGTIDIQEGTENPNDVPPANFGVLSFYRRIVGGNTVSLFVYSGSRWIEITDTEKKGSLVSVNSDYTIPTNVSCIRTYGSSLTITIPQADDNRSREIDFITTSESNIISFTPAIITPNGNILSITGKKYMSIKSNGDFWYSTNLTSA